MVSSRLELDSVDGRRVSADMPLDPSYVATPGATHEMVALTVDSVVGEPGEWSRLGGCSPLVGGASRLAGC